MDVHNATRIMRLQRILSKAEMQSIPYIGGRHVPANPEHALLNQQKADTLLNMIPYDENDPSVAENGILALLPSSEWERSLRCGGKKTKPKPRASCKAPFERIFRTRFRRFRNSN